MKRIEWKCEDCGASGEVEVSEFSDAWRMMAEADRRHDEKTACRSENGSRVMPVEKRSRGNCAASDG